jgi:hypothetical protein
LPRNHENMSKYLKIVRFSQKSWKTIKVFKNNEIFTLPKNHENMSKYLKIVRFSQKSWKTIKVFKNHEIFTLPRNHKNMSKYLKIVRFSQKSWKTVKVFENHEIFTFPRNHEKPSKRLPRKIFKNREIFPEIMKNRQSVWKSWDFHISQKSWKTIKKIFLTRRIVYFWIQCSVIICW